MNAETLDPAHEAALRERVDRIPCVVSLGIREIAFTPGGCSATFPHRREYDGIFASYHGGLLMTAADCVACFAILTRTAAHEPMATTDMSIRFLFPCFGDVRAVATVLKLGRTLCPVVVDLFDADQKRIAVAQVTYIRMPGQSTAH